MQNSKEDGSLKRALVPASKIDEGDALHPFSKEYKNRIGNPFRL
jgi:hypothetical protein